MTFTRTLILAGFVAVTGASSALAGAHPRNVAWKEYIQKAPATQEGRSATMSAPSGKHEQHCGLFNRDCYNRQ